MPNLVTPGMRMQTTPGDITVDALARRLYGDRNVRGPYFYPRSPYALGDLVPGMMPTQFGTMSVLPDAAQLLATSNLSSAMEATDPAGLRSESTGGTIVQSASLEAPLNPVTPRSLAGTMPSVLRPRVDATALGDEAGSGIACWVQSHPLLSAGAAVLLYVALRGGRK